MADPEEKPASEIISEFFGSIRQGLLNQVGVDTDLADILGDTMLSEQTGNVVQKAKDRILALAQQRAKSPAHSEEAKLG